MNSIWERVKHYANGVRILTDMVGPDGKVVPLDVAERRAAICAKCNCNERGGVVAKAVAWAIKEQLDIRNELELTTSHDNSLKSCRICDCVLKLKVLIPIEKIRKEQTPEEFDQWPDWCWIKNEP